MKRYFHTLLIAITAILISSCGKEESATDSTRVLLVYIGVDNNLNGYEYEKLWGLRDGWTGNPNDQIVAYVDEPATGARLIEISDGASAHTGAKDESGFTIIAEYGKENSASAVTLRRVINHVKTLYNPDNFGLLIFSHASGWLPQGVYNSFSEGNIPPTASLYSTGTESRSVIIDKNSEMELTDFAEAIPEGMFDYIIFEACFMAGIEVAYELRDKVPYIFASSAEIIHPGFASVYPSATGHIMRGDLVGFGQRMYNHIKTYDDGSPQGSATYSVINTAGLSALADFVQGNCDLSKTVGIIDIQRFDRLKTATLFFDFKDYYGRLLIDQSKYTEFEILIDDCVSWQAATDKFMTYPSSYNGFKIEHHSGLTTYIPQEQYPGLNTAYSQTAWGARLYGNI